MNDRSHNSKFYANELLRTYDNLIFDACINYGVQLKAIRDPELDKKVSQALESLDAVRAYLLTKLEGNRG